MLDTNTCIYIIKQKPPEVLQRFTAFAVGDVTVASVTAAELTYGAHKSQQVARNLQAVEQFLLPLMVAEFDHPAARTYGRIRAHLEQRGTPIGSLDLLIAAHALALGVPLVTNNTREFARVPGLQTDNWATS